MPGKSQYFPNASGAPGKQWHQCAQPFPRQHRQTLNNLARWEREQYTVPREESHHLGGCPH